MLETIMQATPWGFASVAVIVAACLLLARMILSAARRFKEINIGKLKLLSEQQAANRTPHATCPHSSDILEVARRTAELRVRVNNIHKDVLKEQMQQADEKLADIVHEMQHQFIRLINQKTNGSIPFIQHQDYSLSELIRDAILPRVRAYIQYRFEDNDYACYAPEAQMEYVAERKRKVIQMTTEMLTQYWCCQAVSRMELTELNRQNLAKYEQIISSIFNEAFALAREGYRKIQSAEEWYHTFVERITGERANVDVTMPEKEGGLQV